jgi:hypothetical protein
VFTLMRDPVFTVQSLDNCLAMIHSLHMKPDDNQWTRPDMELWEDVIQEIEEHSEDCVEFYGFDTNESFELMTYFTDRVGDDKLKELLFRRWMIQAMNPATNQAMSSTLLTERRTEL